MSISLLPDIMVDGLTSITPERLKMHGIHLLMMDFDNTIVPYTTDVPQKEFLDWLAGMEKSDVRLCVVSNSKNSRVPKFCKEHGIDCITHARKPFSDGIVRCVAKYGVEPNACGLVGDQIFTDTLGANCAGIKSILVPAIDNHNIWLKMRHVAEMPFIFMAKKRRIRL